MKKQPIGPIGEPLTLPNGTTVPLSPAYAVGHLILLSGQLAFGADMKIVGGGIVEQTQQCLKNIESLLFDLGLGLVRLDGECVGQVVDQLFVVYPIYQVPEVRVRGDDR